MALKIRFIICWATVFLGFAAVVVGVAFIYWPAALIVGGSGSAFGAATLFNVAPDPPPPASPRPTEPNLLGPDS